MTSAHDEPSRRVPPEVAEHPGLVADEVGGERRRPDLGVADGLAGVVEQLQDRRPPVVHPAHADRRGERAGPEQVGELLEERAPARVQRRSGGHHRVGEHRPQTDTDDGRDRPTTTAVR